MGTYAPLISLLVPGLTVVVIVLVYALSQRGPAARKLGQPYSVNAKVDGWSGLARLTIEEGRLVFAFQLVNGASPYAETYEHVIRVPVARVRTVRVRDVGIEIDYDSLDGPAVLVVITRESGAKDRLLWELAVVAPAAVEAGIPADTPRAAATAATALPPTGHAAESSTPPEAATALRDLDARMTSLGSALAGPADRPPPPPPRSGLGNGLFVAPPRESDG